MYLIMGPIGSGKSVQGKLLEENCGFEWVSTGNLLRSVKDREIQAILESGQLLDDERMYQILSDFISGRDHSRQVVFDGFPRTLHQAQWLVKKAPELHDDIKGVLFLLIDEAEAKKRLLARNRRDDNEAAIRVRIKAQQKDMKAIIEFFKDKSVPVHEIDAMGSVDEVQSRILAAIECTQK